MPAPSILTNGVIDSVLGSGRTFCSADCSLGIHHTLPMSICGAASPDGSQCHGVAVGTALLQTPASGPSVPAHGRDQPDSPGTNSRSAGKTWCEVFLVENLLGDSCLRQARAAWGQLSLCQLPAQGSVLGLGEIPRGHGCDGRPRPITLVDRA